VELPAESVQRALVQRYARILAAFGRELGERPMVLPTSRFFPDQFTGDVKSLNRLVSRMREHAGMTDIPIHTRVVEEGESDGAHGGGCGSGACSKPSSSGAHVERVVDEGDRWRLDVPARELGHPVVLTTNVARSLALIFLLETRDESQPLDEPLDVTLDLGAVALGFGVLLLEGSHIYAKSCGGPSVGRVTRLGCPELVIPFALFAARGGHPLRRAAKELSTTQRALFDEARGLVESNPELVAALRARPEQVAAGEFKLDESRPWLLRVLARKTGRAAAKDPLDVLLESDAALDELENLVPALPRAARAERRKPVDPERDELRAMVDEALASRADAE
jgi:hypothetical protein